MLLLCGDLHSVLSGWQGGMGVGGEGIHGGWQAKPLARPILMMPFKIHISLHMREFMNYHVNCVKVSSKAIVAELWLSAVENDNRFAKKVFI